ncbi:MAG: T9SS type A sorting domain-containing protein [Paludibacter sp.]|nr:T9SS type A sorting domain-containing protein [Paludibacter sp.]
MRKLFTLIITVAALWSTLPANSQNLLAGWDGNGITATNSEANKWGWASTFATTAWGTANGAGVRFMDVTHTLSTGGSYTGRVFLYRWDGTYVGSTLSLGHGDGTSTTQTGITLNGCSAYTFNGYYEWWNNATRPTYKFAVTDAPSGGNIISTTSVTPPSDTKNILYPFSLSFSVPTTGTYYIQVTQTAGLNPSGGLIGLGNLSLNLSTAQILSVSQTSMKLNDSIYTKKFFVSGNALVNDISLSAPSGVTLNKTTITAANAQCGDSVMATYNKTSLVIDTIRIISGSTLSKTIYVYATPLIINGVTDGGFELGNTDAAPLGKWKNDLGVSLGGAATSRVMTNNGYQSHGTNCMLLRYLGDAASYNYIGTKIKNLVPGASYRFDFNYKQSNSGAANAQINVYAVPQNIGDSTQAIGGTWFKTTVPADITVAQPISTGSVSFVALSDTCSMVFEKASAFIGVNFIIYLDDMTLTKTADPSATAVANVISSGQVKVYANNNKVVAEINSTKTTAASISVYNVQGAMVAYEKTMLEAGANHVVLKANLPSGMYMVKVALNDKTVTQKLVK